MSTTNDTPAGRPRGAARPGYSLDIRLWKVTKTAVRSRPYQLRWVVAGKVAAHVRHVRTRRESTSELWQAMRRGRSVRDLSRTA